MVKSNNGGIGNEPFWKSRRLYSAVLAGVAAVLMQLGYNDIAASLVAVVGGLLGVTSWVKPK